MIDVQGIKPWSGQASGRFHIDFLGVKTDARFWKGIKPTPAGWRRIGAPALSELYLEYTACIMACAVARKSFKTLEIGGGWGVWSVRATAIAQRLNVPIRTTTIEMMPSQIQQISQHFLANGLNPRCHQVIEAAVSPDGGDAWIRANDPLDPGARVVHDDWARRNATLSPMGLPAGLPMPCKDGTYVSRTPTKRLHQIVPAGAAFDFVHLRIGPGPHRLLDDPVLAPENIGVLVLPSVNPVDAPLVDEKMAATRFRPICAIEPGHVFKGTRGDIKVNNGLRIYAGGRVPPATADDMAAQFTELLG